MGPMGPTTQGLPPELLQALIAAEARLLTDGWVLDRRRSGADIAGLVSWVNALWLHSTYEPEPEPVGFFITT